MVERYSKRHLATQVYSANGLRSIFKFSEILGSTSYCVVLFDFVYKFCHKGNISLGQRIFCVLTCNCCYNDIWRV